MFVTNNHDSFHLWWKKNLIKHQNVPKYYGRDCLKNFLLHFMSSLWVPIWKFSKFGPQWKDRKSSYQVIQIFSLLCKSVTLILDWNYVKSLRVTNIVKRIKFERAWGKLEPKYCFQRQSLPKYMRQNLVLVWNRALRQKFNFNFWTAFRLYWQNFDFGRKTGH